MTTIYALSSGHGKAGVAVIRISGPAAGTVLRGMTGVLTRPRFVSLKPLRNPRNGEVIDHSLVIWFPGPQSFTGEDMAELHVHGGRAVVEAVFDALSSFEGLSPAEPGEFSRRAFENGKLDLTEAEGLADLIDAETEAQRLQALRQSSGALRTIYENWRLRMIEALASVEAELDFSDEGDVPEEVAQAARTAASALRDEIAEHLADHRGEILRDGLRVAISGPPNAGKSSLMNALARRDVAIVSAEAGTTRDVIEIRLDLNGFPVILMDTAGIREAAESDIEREGIRRAIERAGQADLVLWISDATVDPTPQPLELSQQARIIEAVNKIDLAPGFESEEKLVISAMTGTGLDALTAELSKEAKRAASIGESPALTRARHRRELERCTTALESFLKGDFSDLELRAEDLREAATALGRLTGQVDVEDILSKIFADFCIGK